MRVLYRIPILPALLAAFAAAAQISEGGLPPSFDPQFSPVFNGVSPVAPVVLASLDAGLLLQQDVQQGEVSRFSAPLPGVDIRPTQAGQWTKLPNGDRVWRCALRSPQALGLMLIFDRFRLAPGARMFAYTPDQKRILGAYTEKSCLPSGEFLIGVLPGEQTILELHEPASALGVSDIHLNRVDFVYDPAGLLPATDGAEDFGQSYACNVNVNCSQGQTWQSEKRGVARILMVFSNGAGWCSGSLLANTSGNGDPYFLTAHHCQIIGLLPNFNIWRFDFDYEAPSCSNPATEPAPKSVLGCQRISYRHETDFLLLKLNQIPGSYNLYFNG
ncbi:MAG: hypothetical protein JNK89_10700, partial [Saprospiraceae bacterium]|nr:hypothetical protein [Saprospiraceae bacterium]